MENNIHVKYINGFPTVKCMKEIIASYFGEDSYKINVTEAYRYNHSIVWSMVGINERIDSFVGFLSDLGIPVRDYHLYERDACRVGHIFLNSKRN